MAASETFNSFLANAPILYPLKTPENLWLSGIFKGYKMGTLAINGKKTSFFVIIATVDFKTVYNLF